jgi:hypothetical protein
MEHEARNMTTITQIGRGVSRIKWPERAQTCFGVWAHTRT